MNPTVGNFAGVYFTLLLTMAGASAAGLSPFLTLLVLGLIGLNQELFRPPGGLMMLANPLLLGLLALPALADLILSKTPRWDRVWLQRTGWVRVAVGAGIAGLASGAFPWDLRLVLAIGGGLAALLVHSARTGAHIGMHQAGTQPFAVPLAGVVEDCLLLSLLLPLSGGNPNVTGLMLGVVIMAVTMTLFLVWSNCRTVLWDLLLGKAEKQGTGISVQRSGEKER